MKILLDNIRENRKKWLELRQDCITASEIATICGLNKFQTPLHLWSVKTGRLPAAEENDFMFIGTELEPLVAKFFNRRTDKRLTQANALYHHPELEWAAASPDYFVGNLLAGDDLELLECKTTQYRNASRWAEGVPNTAHLQLMWQMGVLGIKSGYAACLCGADPTQFYYHRIEFDQSIFDQAVGVAERFREMIRKDLPPEPTGDDVKLVEAMTTKRSEDVAILPDEVEDLCIAWEQVKEDIKQRNEIVGRLEKEEQGIRARITQAMGKSSRAVCGDYEIALKEVNRAEYVAKASKYYKFNITKKGN